MCSEFYVLLTVLIHSSSHLPCVSEQTTEIMEQTTIFNINVLSSLSLIKALLRTFGQYSIASSTYLGFEFRAIVWNAFRKSIALEVKHREVNRESYELRR